MLKNIHNSVISSILLLICLSFLPACAQDKIEYRSPQGYDLTQPETFYLADALHEISGITFPFQDSDVLAAIEDETGTLYQLTLGKKGMQESKFAKKGDYEGIAATQQYILVLKSNGTLFSMPLVNQDADTQNVIKTEDLIPSDEYEGLAVDPSTDLIYVLCKECKIDKKADFVTGYIFEIQNKQPVLKGNFQIDSKKINSIQDLKGKDFRPSALAKNTRTNEWYVLSSINDMLVITDHNWNVKAVYSLNPNQFNQPEGIAFDRHHNLYISNEGGDKTKKGNIHKFTINP